MDARCKRIGVLLGGCSPERAVSLETGGAVLAALVERGHDARPIYVDRDVDLVLRQARIDVAFVALHGRDADGPVQGLLETLAIPYTGPSLGAAALASDKLKTKELLRLHNLPTPHYYVHRAGAGGVVEQHGSFGFPCVVKPRAGGSGVGVARADDWGELEAAIEAALVFDDDVLVERWVAGREIQVGVLDGEVVGVAEVASDSGILDAAARFGRTRTHVVVPPRLGVERTAGVTTLALRACALVGATGLARVDVLVSGAGNESVLEVNALPDLGPLALVPKLLAAGGVAFGDLVERLVDGACLHAGGRLGRRETSFAGDISVEH